MKVSSLSDRVDELSEKIVDPPKERIARFDVGAFTEEEKVLFNKIDELRQKCGGELTPDLNEEEKRLVFKASGILFEYALGAFKLSVLCLFGNPDGDLEKWYFNLHVYNFLADLIECYQNLRCWPLKEREDFVKLLHDTGLVERVFRFPDRVKAASAAAKPARGKEDEHARG